METRRIWKWELAVTDEQHILMPRDPEILAVAFQGEQLCVWAMVEPENNRKPYTFRIFGTGNRLPEQPWGTYLCTLQHPGMHFIWHVFHGD